MGERDEAIRGGCERREDGVSGIETDLVPTESYCRFSSAAKNKKSEENTSSSTRTCSSHLTLFLVLENIILLTFTDGLSWGSHDEANININIVFLFPCHRGDIWGKGTS